MDMEILAQKYLRELIKEECWDSMAVKGKVLKVRFKSIVMAIPHINKSLTLSSNGQLSSVLFYFVHSGISIEDRSQ